MATGTTRAVGAAVPAGTAFAPQPRAPAPTPPPSGPPTARRTRRDTVVDLSAIVLSLLSYGVTVTFADEADAQLLSGPARAVDVAALVLGCAAVWWRRRRPVALAVALLVTSCYLDATQVPALVLVFTVAVHRGPRPLAAMVALGLGAGAAYATLRPQQGVPVWLAVLLQLVALLAVAGWGTAVRHRRALAESLRERARRAEADQQLRVDRARQLERTRIAREMHDVLAHRISLISMHAGALEYRPDATPAQVAAAAGVVRESAHQALEDLRQVLGVLRSTEPEPLAAGDGTAVEPPQPSLADLPALVAECRRAGARVDLTEVLPDGAAVPEQLGRTAYRVAQEGLTNARKHAPGARVRLGVAGGPGGELVVRVVNSRGLAGTAAGSLPGSGTGLVGLSERVVLAGGRLTAGWRDGAFELEAALPWPAA